MKLADLGEITGELLVFGGPVSNLRATRALIAEARARGVPPERCICTGDTVAYCAEPAETVAVLRDFGCVVVAGNCERQLAEDAGDCGCGFDAGSTCDRLSAAWYAHARAGVDAEARAWMAALPDGVVFTHEGRRVAAIHGGASDIARFLWPSSPVSDFEQEIAVLESRAGPIDMVLAGHCGLAFARQIGARLWINAGAIGMPPHDGRPLTRYAIVSGGNAVFHRLAYDHEAAAAAMEAAGLTQGYEQTLRRGIWPSEDVLPKALRR